MHIHVKLPLGNGYYEDNFTNIINKYHFYFWCYNKNLDLWELHCLHQMPQQR